MVVVVVVEVVAVRVGLVVVCPGLVVPGVGANVVAGAGGSVVVVVVLPLAMTRAICAAILFLQPSFLQSISGGVG